MRGIVIVAERSTPTNRELISAFRSAGVAARRLGGPQLRTARVLGRLAGVVLLGRADVSRRLDGVGDTFWELRRLEQEGVPVLNPSRALLRCHDKLLTALRLGRCGLPHPRTALVSDPDATPSFAGPWVIKPRFGSWGRDVERCGTEAELRDALRRLSRRGWFRRHGAIIQAYVPNEGADLRLVVARGSVVGAIERLASAGEWRTNVSLGGLRRAIEPPSTACELARRAAAAVEADLIGIDLLPTTAGYTVIELNGAVDFTSEYAPDIFARIATRLAPAPAPAPSARPEPALTPTPAPALETATPP
jgi:[lysine-biosynthesis-protein LysW]---L-2-aminoadipate ligase